MGKHWLVEEAEKAISENTGYTEASKDILLMSQGAIEYLLTENMPDSEKIESISVLMKGLKQAQEYLLENI